MIAAVLLLLAAEPCATAQANERLAAADAALARHAPREANAALDEALQALGSAYRRPRTHDDTSMHLILARSEARRGRWTRAATLKRRILVERLGLCEAPR